MVASNLLGKGWPSNGSKGEEPMKAVIEVTDCQDCPFANDHRSQGECWTECQHAQHNQGAYGNILWGCQEKFKVTPSWCPLKEKNQ